MKLFCLTHVGGTSGFYGELKALLGLHGIEVIGLEYAGHGSRSRERFYSDFAELSRDMISQIKSCLCNYDTYALMGYSMGSISLTEIMKTILLSPDLPKPIHVFLAAHAPQVKKELVSSNTQDMDIPVKEWTISFGGVPEKLMHNKTFWRMYLPLYSADFRLIYNYDFENINLSTNIPATFFYADTDTPLQEMKLWNQYYTGKNQYYAFSGNHFFIKEHWQEIATIIREELT